MLALSLSDKFCCFGVFVFNRFLFFRFSFHHFFILVLVFVNEFVIFWFFAVFVFVNKNHTAFKTPKPGFSLTRSSCVSVCMVSLIVGYIYKCSVPCSSNLHL